MCKKECVSNNAGAQVSPPAMDESTRSIDSAVMSSGSDTEDDPTVRCPCDCNEVRSMGVQSVRDLKCV